MKISQELRDRIDAAEPGVLRGIAEVMTANFMEATAAGRSLVDAHRVVLDLLRAGRIAEATEVAATVVAMSDEAQAEDRQAALAEGDLDALLGLPPQGRA